MANLRTDTLFRQLRQTIFQRDVEGWSDGQLLRAFVEQREEAAFEALLRRHGPMVHGVCRRVLRAVNDADDAFQATFLVLLRKAPSLLHREVLGDWLHGVALRTAWKARSAAAKRRSKERNAPPRVVTIDDSANEWRGLLDAEIARLPEKYRMPLVLCDLQNRPRKQAARQLGCPEGTLSGRLARARQLLARRLTRRGFGLSQAVFPCVLARELTVDLPHLLLQKSWKVICAVSSDHATEFVPNQILALAKGVVKAMYLGKIKKAAIVGMFFGFLLTGLGAFRYVAQAEQKESRQTEASPPTSPPVPTAPATVRAPRLLQFDLEIEQILLGTHKLLAEPRLIALEGKEASCEVSTGLRVNCGGGQTETIPLGTKVKMVARTEKDGKMRLDVTASRSAQLETREDVEVETYSIRKIRSLEPGNALVLRLKTDATPYSIQIKVRVREQQESDSPKTIAAAERDLRMAEYYRRTGHTDSAMYYYVLIRQRYPDTIYAEKALERWQELKKQLDRAVNVHLQSALPKRVAEVKIIGNRKIADREILDCLNLYPGQVFTERDLQEAEEKMRRIKGVKSPPKVRIVNTEENELYKDIEIVVEEK